MEIDLVKWVTTTMFEGATPALFDSELFSAERSKLSPAELMKAFSAFDGGFPLFASGMVPSFFHPYIPPLANAIEGRRKLVRHLAEWIEADMPGLEVGVVREMAQISLDAGQPAEEGAKMLLGTLWCVSSSVIPRRSLADLLFAQGSASQRPLRRPAPHPLPHPIFPPPLHSCRAGLAPHLVHLASQLSYPLLLRIASAPDLHPLGNTPSLHLFFLHPPRTREGRLLPLIANELLLQDERGNLDRTSHPLRCEDRMRYSCITSLGRGGGHKVERRAVYGRGGAETSGSRRASFRRRHLSGEYESLSLVSLLFHTSSPLTVPIPSPSAKAVPSPSPNSRPSPSSSSPPLPSPPFLRPTHQARQDLLTSAGRSAKAWRRSCCLVVWDSEFIRLLGKRGSRLRGGLRLCSEVLM